MNDDTGNTEINAQQLRGKQSVRATFKLPEQMIDLLRVAAAHLGVKQKSLIDQLVEEREILDQVAREAQSAGQQDTPRRKKTFVLSRKSLGAVDEISRKYCISRDYLVEMSIMRLAPFVHAEQEKHTSRRLLLQEVEAYLEQGKRLLAQADTLLSRDDSFRVKLEKIVSFTDQNVQDLRKFVKEKKALLY